MKQLPLPIKLPAADGFASLVVGPNAQAVAHLQTLQPGTAPVPPVYLWGPKGSGKTRLLRALAVALQGAGGQVAWFEAGMPLPWPLPETTSAVLLDDCQALSDAQQQAAFALFVEAGSLGLLWAAAGRLPPVDLPLRDDLRSRLGWGHVFALQPLAEAETRGALQREASRRGITLSLEVLDYLLTRFERNLAHLMALLDSLDRFSLAEQREVTVPLLKKMLAEQAEAASAPALAPTTDAPKAQSPTDQARPASHFCP